MSERSLSPILKVKNLQKIVNQGNSPLTILQDVNLEINPGESCALIGESGSGKSTLLAILAGLDDATSGDVLLLNKSLGLLDEDERAALRADGVGFVFQSFLLVPTLTALENVLLPLMLKSKKGGEKYCEEDAKASATSLLTSLGLEHRLHHLPALLSGGEQQRVALARAFIAQPKILFADEPTGNLDRLTGERIVNLLFSLNQQYRTTLVLVTHDEALAKRCDIQMRLTDGVLMNVSSQSNNWDEES